MTAESEHYEYPFEEFVEHYRGIHLPRDNPPSSYEAAVIRTFEYMRSRCIDEQEAMYKASRFMIIMTYLAEHADSFDRDDFAVLGSEDVGGLIGEHLLWAAHDYFTSRPLQPTHGPSPELIRALACQYRDRTEEPGASD